MTCGVVFIWGGLFWTQVIQGPTYRQQAENNRTRLIELPAARGSILDRKGNPLVEDRIGFELAVFPQELADHPDTWRRLEAIVGVSVQELIHRYRNGFQGPFAPVVIVRDLSAETAFLLEEKHWEIPGAMVRPVPRRSYLLGEAIGSVVGYIGFVSRQEWTRLKSYGYTIRDLVGKQGLEKQYDSILRGTSGGLQVEVDSRGKLVRQLGVRQPIRGRSITLSLDGQLQSLSSHLLREFRGALGVMDCSTGEILALVSSPSVDPNAFLDPARQREVREMLHSPDRPMFHRAIGAAVPPGSTFKVAVAYQALATHKIEPQTAFECGGSFSLGRSLFRCWMEEGHGPQTVPEALAHSCNVFFYQTGRRLGSTGLAEGSRLFGLGHPTGIDLPGEASGLVPDPHWMKAALGQPWQEGDTISFSIGQGPLQVTPIQMLALVNAIATGGQMPTPHLLTKVEGESGVRLASVRRIQLDPRAVAAVKDGMERVMSLPDGTGKLAQCPPLKVAAKTGTAQVPRGSSHAWFYGYAPADHPRVSFVIFLEHGGKGGLQAARVARHLLASLKELGYLS